MDQSTVSQNSSLSVKVTIGFGILGIVFVGLIVFFCCRNSRRNYRRQSIESFQQLYFSKTSSNQTNKPVIERWSSVDQPSLTFYRVYIEEDSDELYRPVTEERARSSIEQSKAMEYTGHEIIFFE